MTMLDERACAKLSSRFVGCECLGTVRMEMYGGDAEIYRIEGVKDLIGAWYPDGAMMLWPKNWLDSLESKNLLGPVPEVLRWELWQQGKAKDQGKVTVRGGGFKRGGANRVILKRGK